MASTDTTTTTATTNQSTKMNNKLIFHRFNYKSDLLTENAKKAIVEFLERGQDMSKDRGYYDEFDITLNYTQRIKISEDE